MKSIFLLLFGLLTFGSINEASARPAATSSVQAASETPRIRYRHPAVHRPNYTLYKGNKKKHRLFGLL
ncbi:hypothetical protein [Hymenobacter cavernae]|uniref:hypothetical protein n=1 Tax=Hymenobacter cavernae TaxID=2044852 RepID=UPI00166B7E02|nr:hypothetical protein [Hymenobacter cavernae]